LTLVSPELGKKFEELRHGMVSNKAGDTSSTNRAEVRLIKDQNSEVVQYEPERVWGTGKGPTPTDYFIASVGFCENVIFAKNASMGKLDHRLLGNNRN